MLFHEPTRILDHDERRVPFVQVTDFNPELERFEKPPPATPRMISCSKRTSELPPYHVLVRPRSAGALKGSLLSSTAGIGAIRLDAINLGNTDLSLRLLFENPVAGPPTDVAASGTALFLPAGSGWTSLLFPLVGPGGLTPIAGSLSTLLANTTAIRLYHSPTLSDVGPVVSAQLGVDNITAVATVPEPTTLGLLATGALGLLVRRRRRP